MSRLTSNVLSSPIATSAIQDDVLTSPVIAPVVASLSQFLSEDVSRSIEKQLIEAELLNAETQETLVEALIQAEVPDVPEESDSMLPIMPSLDHEDDQSEDNLSWALVFLLQEGRQEPRNRLPLFRFSQSIQ
jgi:hypothetical protein